MYSAKIDGEATTFGTSGFLYRSNKLMYDRKTNTLWSSLLGVPVIGDLARRDDLTLAYFPVSLTTWAEWREERPHTKILSNETGYYAPNRYEAEPNPRSIYYSYRADPDAMFPVSVPDGEHGVSVPDAMFPVWDRDARLSPKDEVLGAALGGVGKAYPVATLRERRAVNDVVGGVEIVILSSAQSSDARVFERGDNEFTLADAADDSPAVPSVIIDQNGAEWDVRPDGLHKRGDDEILPRVPSLIYFWFGWRAFHPDTEVWE